MHSQSQQKDGCHAQAATKPTRSVSLAILIEAKTHDDMKPNIAQIWNRHHCSRVKRP